MFDTMGMTYVGLSVQRISHWIFYCSNIDILRQWMCKIIKIDDVERIPCQNNIQVRQSTSECARARQICVLWCMLAWNRCVWCEMDGYAYIDACSDVTGVCEMNRERGYEFIGVRGRIKVRF